MTLRQWLMVLCWPLLLWLLVSLLGLGTTMMSLTHLSSLRQHIVQLHHQLTGQQKTAEQAAQHAQVYALYQQHARHWSEIGLSTPTDTEAWQATMYSLQQSSGLPHVRYALNSTLNDAQHWPDARPPVPLALQITPVEFFLSTTHEDDALQWVWHLQARYAEALLVRMCEWTLSENQLTIEAHCLLHWMHLPFDLPPGKEPA